MTIGVHQREETMASTIDLGDGEQRTDPVSYAAQVPEGEGPARRVSDG